MTTFNAFNLKLKVLKVANLNIEIDGVESDCAVKRSFPIPKLAPFSGLERAPPPLSPRLAEPRHRHGPNLFDGNNSIQLSGKTSRTVQHVRNMPTDVQLKKESM